MKANRLLVIAILIAAGSLHVSAQENLKALIQKCEKMESVNINIIRNRDEETKKLTRTITNISFRNNEALLNEFITAFEKDREMADQEIENKSGGKIKNIFYRFGNTNYSFSVGEDGSASISVIDNKED